MIQVKKPLICIDAGHGGTDIGAIGFSGQKEAILSLKIAKELALQLDLLGIDSYLTRIDDTFISLADRVSVRPEAICFVSLHCNAVNTPQVEGIETIYSKVGGKHKALANFIQQSLIKYCQNHKNRGIKMSPSNDYPRNLYVLASAKIPACLVECEFISNEKQEIWLSSDDGQKQIANAIAQGIKSYLNQLG